MYLRKAHSQRIRQARETWPRRRLQQLKGDDYVLRLHALPFSGNWKKSRLVLAIRLHSVIYRFWKSGSDFGIHDADVVLYAHDHELACQSCLNLGKILS